MRAEKATATAPRSWTGLAAPGPAALPPGTDSARGALGPRRPTTLYVEPMSATGESPPRAGQRRGVYTKTPQRRREIVQAAAAVFAASGYSGGSLRQVAKDIDVSVTSVMHHFPSKELLLQAVLDHADAEAGRIVDVDPARDGFAATVVRFAEDGRRHPHLLRLLAVLSSEASAPDHPAHGWFVERYRRVEDAVAQWAALDPRLDLTSGSDAARVLARRVVAVWDGLQLQWLLTPDFDLVDELGATVEALVAGSLRGDPRQSSQ